MDGLEYDEPLKYRVVELPLPTLREHEVLVYSIPRYRSGKLMLTEGSGA